jgi:hypothetical protein
LKDTSESSKPFEWIPDLKLTILANNLNFIVAFESERGVGHALLGASHNTCVRIVIILNEYKKGALANGYFSHGLMKTDAKRLSDQRRIL